MATVPPWISKGYVYQSGPGARAYQITEWRATQTQVVVHVAALPGELRFDLDSLLGIGSRSRGLRLLPPDDIWVLDAIREQAVRSIVADLRTARGERLDPSIMSIDELLSAALRIREAAATAAAKLGVLL